MKKTTHNIYDSPKDQLYKKKYLERKLEERDANKQIDDYTHKPEQMSYPQSMDEKRTM